MHTKSDSTELYCSRTHVSNAHSAHRYLSPTLTTGTPDVGTLDFLEPIFLRGPAFPSRGGRGPPDGRYDPAARDVWTLGEVLFFLIAGAELSKRFGAHKYSFFYIALAHTEDHWSADWRAIKAHLPKSMFYEADGRPNMDVRNALKTLC